MSAICCSSYVVQPISHQQTIMMTEGYHHYSNAVSGHYHDFAVPRPNDGLLLHQQRQSSSKRLEEALVRAIPRASSGKVSQRIAQLQQQIYSSCQMQQQQPRFQQQRRPTRPLSVDPTKDYSIPLSVDCSVEYDLPRVIRPPPGAQPLLLIAPRLQRPVQSACWSTEGLVSSSGSLLPGRSSSCSTSSGDSGHWSETCSSSSSSSSSVPPAWMMRGDYPLQRTGSWTTQVPAQQEVPSANYCCRQPCCRPAAAPVQQQQQQQRWAPYSSNSSQQRRGPTIKTSSSTTVQQSNNNKTLDHLLPPFSTTAFPDWISS